MQASGSRPAPSASASHSAHQHRSGGFSRGLARRLRGGFMTDTLRGGYDISGPVRAPVPLTPAPLIPGARNARLTRVDAVLADHLLQAGDLGAQPDDLVG